MSPEMGVVGYTDAEADARIAIHAALPNIHHAQVHGIAEHTDVTRELFLPVNEGFVAVGTPKMIDFYAVVEGGANLNEPMVGFVMRVPSDFVSFTSLELVWCSTPAAGNMYWKIESRFAAEGETYKSNTETPAIGVTATNGVELINVQEPANRIAFPGLAKGDYVGFYVRRLGANALDTLNAAVHWFGMLFTYVAEQ